MQVLKLMLQALTIRALGAGFQNLGAHGADAKRLEGSWDLAIAYSWACSFTYSPPSWTYVGCPSCKQGYKPNYK